MKQRFRSQNSLAGVHHIYVFGEIFPDESQFAEDFGMVSAASIKRQMDAAPQGTTEFKVHINSRGGDVAEGFAIHDMLANSGKKITTIIEGLCASIATIVALAGSTRQMTKNSEFMIHNPWGTIQGTAEEVQQYADYLAETEKKIVDFYATQTGGDKKKIASLMDKETFLTSDEALEMKFITEVLEPITALAKININSNKIITMDKFKELTDQIMATLNKLSGKEQPKALCLKTADNKHDLTIKSESDKPAVGDEVTIEGKAAPDGAYEMPDGTILNIKASKVEKIEVKPVVQPTGDLQVQLDAANNRIKELENQSNLQLGQLTAINALLAGISSTHTPATDPAGAVAHAKGTPDKPKTLLERRAELKKEKETK